MSQPRTNAGATTQAAHTQTGTPVPTPSARRAGRTSDLPPSLILGGALLTLVALAVIAALLGWHGSIEIGAGQRLEGPSAAHLAGTDKLGRDILGLTIVGSLDAVLVALAVAVVAGSLGALMGLAAALAGRATDLALSSLIDLLIAFPTLLLAMLVVTVQGASRRSVILALGISGAGLVARTTRVTAARVLRTDYVTAARVLAVPTPRLVARHVIPAVAPTLATQVTLVASGAVLAAASLSYLGLGSPPTEVSWGRLLQDAQTTVSAQPWAAIAPGAAVIIFVLGLNLLADGLREWGDPTVSSTRKAGRA